MSRPRPKTTARPKAALLLLAATFALSAAPSVVALSPLQQKLNEFVENVQGAVADKDHVAANTARAIDNAKSRLASSGPLVTPDFFNKSAALDGGGGDDGIAVTVVGDPAQALLVGGVPAGNIVCYVNEAGVVVGLQQGNVTVCGVSSQSVTVKMDMGYVSGLRVARSGAAIGLLEFQVTTPGTVVPSKYQCGTAPLSSKPRALIPPGHALVSFDGTCDSSNTTIVAGRRLLATNTLTSVTAVAAPVKASDPVHGGAMVIKRVNAPCDGVTMYQVPAPDVSVSICAPITPPCDHSVSYTAVQPNSTTDRVCKTLTPPCVGNTYEKKAPTHHSDRVCAPLTAPCDGTGYWTASNATTQRDRVCRRVKTCGEGYYQARPPTAYSDRVCAPVSSPCAAGFYESVAATATTDRVCLPVTECDGVTTYEFAPATPTNNTMCRNVTQCVQDVTYRSAPPNRTADAVCSPVKACLPQQFEVSPPTLLVDRVCGWPDGILQCQYASNYGAPSGYSVNANDVVVCINQQTAPSLYLQTDCNVHGRTVSNWRNDTKPVLVDLSVVRGGTFGPDCLVSVLDKTGTAIGKIQVQQGYDTGLPGQSAKDLVVTDKLTGGGTSTTFPVPTDMPFIYDNVTSLGGIDFRARSAFDRSGTNRPSILEIFGPTCNASAPSTVIDIRLIGEPRNITASLGSPNAGTTAFATITGNAVNCRTTPQSSSYQSSVTRTRTVSWTSTESYSKKYSIATEFKTTIGIPFVAKEGFTLKLGYEFTYTGTTSNTTTDTVTGTTTFSITDSVPPLSNCTLRGTVATGVVMWSQNVAYTIVDACSNRPKTFDTTVNFEANGVVMTQSALDVTFEQCSPPDTSVCRPASPVPPPAQTCSSNVQCNAAGFTGNCCPKDDGTYMLCCAQAIAHPKCDATTYTGIYDAICPSATNVYASCC